jgi:L-alanine-DL-glutamate epimerase-like enolase superfamily enzyme
MSSARAAVDRLDVIVYRVPTEAPESDGTLTWDATTVVVALPEAEGTRGLGFSYAGEAAGACVREALAGVVVGRDAMDVPGAWQAMVGRVRNIGRPGVASVAIAAVDCALWDLKAKLLDLSIARLLGAVRDAAPVYGSGGFTSYTDEELGAQLGSWVHELGIPRVKLKVGSDWRRSPERDVEESRSRARRLATTPSCSSTRTARTGGSSRCSSPTDSPPTA